MIVVNEIQDAKTLVKSLVVGDGPFLSTMGDLKFDVSCIFMEG